MPDHDIFRWHINSWWRKAATINLAVDDDPNGLSTIIDALGQEVKSRGCPGLPEIVEIIKKATESPGDRAARQVASEELSRVAREEACDVTQVAVNIARLLIRRRRSAAGSRLDVATQVLAGIATSRMYHPAVIHTLAEEGGVAYSDVMVRLERRWPQIAAAPETLSMANTLLADPSGTSIKKPRPKRTRLPQADILHIPLTNL